MATALRHNPARALAGVGLVELMVAVLLGALITAGAIALFTANRQSFRLQDNLAQAQEAGSFALEFLARDLRRAGYPGEGLNNFAAFNASNVSAAAPANTITANDITDTRARVINGATVNVDFVDDQLAIVFRPDAFSPNTDCTGAAPAGFNPATDYVSNVYRVQNTADGLDRELVCQGFLLRTNGSGTLMNTIQISEPQALVSGVESFQVLYGIDTSFTVDTSVIGCPVIISPNEPTLYVNGGQLANAIAFGRRLTDPAPAGQAQACDRRISPVSTVRAVRVALLVRTSADVDATVPANRLFTLLDRTLTGGATSAVATNFPPINDGRVRRVFLTTVALRNIE